MFNAISNVVGIIHGGGNVNGVQYQDKASFYAAMDKANNMDAIRALGRKEKEQREAAEKRNRDEALFKAKGCGELSLDLVMEVLGCSCITTVGMMIETGSLQTVRQRAYGVSPTVYADTLETFINCSRYGSDMSVRKRFEKLMRDISKSKPAPPPPPAEPDVSQEAAA